MELMTHWNPGWQVLSFVKEQETYDDVLRSTSPAELKGHPKFLPQHRVIELVIIVQTNPIGHDRICDISQLFGTPLDC